MTLSPGLETTLWDKAIEMTKNAYAPYSKFYVGAALLTEKGNIFQGCNVENISYGLCSCAERNAIFNAIASEGPGMRFVAIAVANGEQVTCTPCGACRQVMSEFANNAKVLYFKQGEKSEASLQDLLPNSFFFEK